MDINRTGVEVAVGYNDPLNTPKALPGDKRIYARDSSGAVIVELWLGNDGSAALFNSLGHILLAANGNINLNGVIIAPNGDITGLNSLILDGKELKDHAHSQGVDSDNDTQQDTGPNN
jgi:hypothetical protein